MKAKEIILFVIIIITLAIIGLGSLLFIVIIGKDPNAPFKIDKGIIFEITIFIIVTLFIFRPSKSKSI